MDSSVLRSKKSKYGLAIALLFGYCLSGCDSVTCPLNGQIRNSAGPGWTLLLASQTFASIQYQIRGESLRWGKKIQFSLL